MCAEDIDLATGVTEEAAQTAYDTVVRVFACSAGFVPVRVGHDEEEVLGIVRDVRLPEVFEVMVVRRRASALYLRDDTPARAEWEDEVGSCPCDEAVVGRQHNLGAKPELVLEKARDDRLDLRALSAVNMHHVDVRRRPVQEGGELVSESVDPRHLGGLHRRQVASYEAVMLCPHGRELRSCGPEKLDTPGLGSSGERTAATLAATRTVPVLGPDRLAHLQPEHVEHMYKALLGKDLNAGTMHHVRWTLNKALNDAVRRRRIPRNLVALAHAPRYDLPEHKPLTVDVAE